FPRNAAEPGARHPESLELPVVKATDNGLLRDLADLGGFAGRENGLHGFIPTLATRAQAKDKSRKSKAMVRNEGVGRTLTLQLQLCTRPPRLAWVRSPFR